MSHLCHCGHDLGHHTSAFGGSRRCSGDDGDCECLVFEETKPVGGPVPAPDILRRKAGKLRVELVPPGLDHAVATVMQAVIQGSSPQKFENDWFVLLNDPPLVVEQNVVAAIKRHANRILAGEEFDQETGLPHLWHILTGASIGNALLYHREDVQALWDRERSYVATPDGPTIRCDGAGVCGCGEPYSKDHKCPPPPLDYLESDLQEEPPKSYGGSASDAKTWSASWLDTHDGQEAQGTYFQQGPGPALDPKHACHGFPCDQCRRLYAIEAITRSQGK